MRNKKPIVILDLETTGINITKDRIVQIAAIKVLNGEIIDKREKLVDPEMPIPKEASAIHGIKDEHVKGQPKFNQIARGFLDFIDGCDIGGFNILRFDIPLLSEELLRLGINPSFERGSVKFVDCYTLYSKKEGRTLEKALEFYCNKKIEKAHDAMGDVITTLDVLKGQIEMYDDIDDTFETIEDILFPDAKPFDLAGKIGITKGGVFVYMEGKHAGKPVRENESYGHWILRSDFPRDTKDKIKFILS